MSVPRQPVRTISAWIATVTMGLGQVLAPAAWAAPDTRTPTLRPLESPENSDSVRQLASGLEEHRPQAGLEEPYAMEGSTAVFHQPFRLEGSAVRLPVLNNSLLDATGGLITIARGARIGANTILKLDDRDGRIEVGAAELFNTVVEQNVAIRDGAKARHTLIQGAPGAGRVVIGAKTELADARIYPGAILLPRRDAAGKLVPTVVQGAEIQGRNVIWGSTLGHSAFVRPHNILIGASVDDHSSLTRAYLDQATYAHKVTGARGIFLWLQPPDDLVPFSPAFYEWLRTRQAAVRFGQVVGTPTPRPVTTAGPHIFPPVAMRVRFNGQQYDVQGQESNAGDGSGISDFNYPGWKSYIVVMGGGRFGRNANVSVPAYVGKGSVIQNNASATLMDAAAPYSFVLPSGVDVQARAKLEIPGGSARPGYFRNFPGMGKASKVLDVHFGVTEAWATLGTVSAAGYQAAVAANADEDTQLGLRTEVAIADGNAREALGYVPKLNESAGVAPETFAAHESRITAMLQQAMAAVGLEEIGRNPSVVRTEASAILSVLEQHGAQLRGYYDDAKRPLVFLSDEGDRYGITSDGGFSSAADRLASAGVTVRALEQLLKERRLSELPPAVIDLQVAAQRLEAGMSTFDALFHARRRVQGTDGWRGAKKPWGYLAKLIGGGELTPDIVQAYHQSYIEWLLHTGLMKRGDEYILGHDPRDDAELEKEGIKPMEFVHAAIRGAQAAGARVVYVGVVPIWVTSYYMVWRGAKAGGNITASHNRYTDTGNKLFGPYGLKLFPEDEYRLTPFFYKAYARLKGTPKPAPLGAIESHQEEALREARKAHLDPENHWGVQPDGRPIPQPLRRWKVITDLAGGAYDPIPNNPQPSFLSGTLQALGATVIVEVGKNKGHGLVNRGSGAGLYEDKKSPVEISRQDAATMFNDHEAIVSAFKAVDADSDVRTGRQRLAVVISDADGDRLILLVYDPTRDVLLAVPGDEAGFIQCTYLLQQSPWAAAFNGAVFANTVESDFFAADAAGKLTDATGTFHLTKRYTGVGDKWILLRAVVAWMRAAVNVLIDEERVDAARLQSLVQRIDGLDGEGMRTAEVAAIMRDLEAIAASHHVSSGALAARLAQPGKIKYAMGSESSGHNISGLYMTTRAGIRTPFYAGDAMKSAINTLVALDRLFPTDDAAIRRIDGEETTLYQYVADPFLRGHQHTDYAFYVAKPRFILDSSEWRAIRQVMEQGVRRVFGEAYSVRPVTYPEEPGLLYLSIDDPSGVPIGAVFGRNSGTESKTSIYVRGLKKDASRLDRLSAVVELATNLVMGDDGSPWYQAKELVLKQVQGGPVSRLALEKAIRESPVVQERDSGFATAPKNLDRLFEEMRDKARVIEVNLTLPPEQQTISFVRRPLVDDDDAWVRREVQQMVTPSGLEEGATVTATAAAPVLDTVRDIVRDVREFFAAAPVPPEFQPGMGLVVDLATGSESDALAALLLPKGAVVVVTTDALLKAEQLVGKTAIEQGIVTVTADGPEAVPAALRVAVSRAQGRVGKTVHVYSGMDAGEIRQVLRDAVAADSADIDGGLTAEEILRRVRPGDDAVSAFLTLLGRARQEWRSLREYV